jgi:hypothetical protein
LRNLPVPGRWVFPVALLLLSLSVSTCAQQLAYTGSLGFTTGEYIFTERTSTIAFRNGFGASFDRFRASLSLPVFLQDSPWIASSGAGGVPTGGNEGADVGGRRQGQKVDLPDTLDLEPGLGDPILNGSLELFSEGGTWPSLRLEGDVKLPLADSEGGFGTGEWDYGVGISLSKRFRRTFVFIDIEYWVLGDLPELELRDGLHYGASIGHLFPGGRISGLLSVSWAARIIETADPPVYAGLGLSYLWDSGIALTLGSTLGLTESSADVQASLGWSLPL